MDQEACDFEVAQDQTQGPLLEYFYPKGNREQISMQITTPLVIGVSRRGLFKGEGVMVQGTNPRSF